MFTMEHLPLFFFYKYIWLTWRLTYNSSDSMIHFISQPFKILISNTSVLPDFSSKLGENNVILLRIRMMSKTMKDTSCN